MLTDAQHAALEAAWNPARAAGVLGSASLETLVEHTAGYASAVCSAFSSPPAELQLDIVDVGTGAGVPGVLLALQLPRCRFVLVDASERRLDHVRRAVRAVDLDERVSVVHARADDLAHDEGHRERFDVALARLLASAAESAELLCGFVRPAGVVVVSVAADAVSTWEQLPVVGLPLGAARVEVVAGDHFVVAPRVGSLDPVLPRRPKTRARLPLLAAPSA